MWSIEWMKLGITGWRSFAFMSWWIICNAGIFIIGYLEQQNDPTLAHLNQPLGYSVLFSRGGGLGLMLQGALILLPVCRNLIAILMRVKFLRRIIPFDKNIHFHKIVAWTMLVFTCVHVSAHLFNFRIVQALNMLGERSALNILWTHTAGITGVIMLATMFLMYTSALAPIRQQSFELFWYTHHLAVPFFAAFLTHSLGCFVRRKFDENTFKCKPYFSYYAALPGILLYLCERILREWRSRRTTYLTKVVAHPSDTLEIQFQKNTFKALAGQYVFVNIPEVSTMEWHPFTLSSCPEDEFDSVHVRIVGDWTKKLAMRLNYYDGVKLSPKDYPTIRIDGPFGTPSQEVFDYETVVLVGAGIGVTPFASILRSIWARCKTHLKTRNKRVHFIWVCRDTQSFEWFQELLKSIEEEAPEGFLTLHLYLTAKLSNDQLANISIHADAPTDAITRLRTQTYYGRPDFLKILRDISNNLSQSSTESEAQKVGVFLCGPNGLKKVLRDAAMGTSSAHVKFHFHSEKF